MLGLALAGGPAEGQRRELLAHGEQISLSFRPSLLAALGLTVSSEVSPRLEEPDLQTFQLPTAREVGLTLLMEGDHFAGFAGGGLRYQGGPNLRWAGGRARLFTVESRIVPVADAAKDSLRFLAEDGAELFVADHLHVRYHRHLGRLEIRNADLRLSPSFATRLGRPEQAGLAVGTVEMAIYILPPLGAGEPPPCPEDRWGLPVDVALLGIDSVGQGLRQPGVKVSLVPAVSLRNVGPGAVAWYRRLSGEFPPYGNAQHPFLVWNLYRLADGRIEQIGRSGLKHGFFTVNNGCDEPFNACSHPFYNNILWPGCQDVYGERTNSRARNLSERSEVDPRTVIWQSCGSRYDADCDGVEDAVADPEDPYERQLEVAEEDLKVEGATYLFEAWYLVRDDIDILNTMGYRQIEPIEGEALWAFPFRSQLALGPALEAWVSPTAPGPGAAYASLADDQGQLQVAVRTRDLGDGRFRYDYAVMNLSFAPKIGEIRIPLAPEASLTAVQFLDGDRQLANDWAAVRDGRQLRWAAEGSPALPWGSLFSFSFESDRAPRPARVEIFPATPAGSPALYLELLAPAPELEAYPLPHFKPAPKPPVSPRPQRTLP